MKIYSAVKYFKLSRGKKTNFPIAAFFDLDGVFWPNSLQSNWLKIKVDTKIIEQLQLIKRKYRTIIVITNQTYGARKFKFKRMYYIILKVRFLLFLVELKIVDAVYVCTHHPFATQKVFREVCTCRKPHSKLFHDAKSNFNINMGNSLMVGDRITDLYSSSEAGIKNNYLISNDEMFNLGENVNFNYLNQMPIFKFVNNLEEFVIVDYKKQNAFSNDLQILYLCAGLGSRLKPITMQVPKPLIKVQGDTIMSRLINQVEANRPASAHIVNISYLANQFAALPSKWRNSVNLSFVYEPTPVGSVKTLLNLAEQSSFTKNILVIHGDLFLSSLYVEKIFFLLNNAQNSIVFGHYRHGSEARSSITIDVNKKVSNIANGQQIDGNEHIVNSGIYYFNHKDLEKINLQKIEGEIVDSILPVLAADNKLFCYVNTLPRISIDSLESLDEVRRFKE